MEAPSFYFDASEHKYISTVTGEVFPSITQMIGECGLIDTRWFTSESCDRGSAVHRLVSDWDLGAIQREDLPQLNSIYKGYLSAHVSAMDLIQPEWSHVEEPMVSAQYRFAGRPDRVGKMYGAVALLEVKSGMPEKAHSIQLALQSILVAPEVNLPAETIPRYALYLKSNGRFKLEMFKDTRKDFAEARRVLKQCGCL